MRILVSEFLVGGASAGNEFPMSMQNEGLAMLQAVTTDLGQTAGHSVVTTLDQRFACPLDAEIVRTENAVHEAAVFQTLLKQVDAVLVIAPETDGILTGRCRQVIAAGRTSLNCSPAAIELCGDKLRLANHLEWQGIPTIRTEQVDFRHKSDSAAWPIVLKPRDGAGSRLTFLIRTAADWDRATAAIFAAAETAKIISQPYVPGRTISVGVNISLDGSRIELLPVGEQWLSGDGCFQYRGGRIPANITLAEREAIPEVVETACKTIPGLAGFIGFDLVLTTDGRPVVVEINPRITTAYIGYRQLFNRPLPERWFGGADSAPNLSQSREFVEFDASKMLNSR